MLEEIDLQSPTTTAENIGFQSAFQLNVLKKGYIRGLSLHFPVGFNYGVRSVKISTSVDAGNDWKQTYLHLQDFLVCHRGDELSGVFNLTSKESKLEMEFDLELKVSQI